MLVAFLVVFLIPSIGMGDRNGTIEWSVICTFFIAGICMQIREDNKPRIQNMILPAFQEIYNEIDARVNRKCFFIQSLVFLASIAPIALIFYLLPAKSLTDFLVFAGFLLAAMLPSYFVMEEVSQRAYNKFMNQMEAKYPEVFACQPKM